MPEPARTSALMPATAGTAVPAEQVAETHCNDAHCAERPGPVEPKAVVVSADFPNQITSAGSVAFTLPDGQKIACQQPEVESNAQGVVMVSGSFTQPCNGSFFFRRQEFDGVAGKLIGHVIFDGEPHAWKVLPNGPDRAPVLQQVPIGEVMCVGYAPAVGDPASSPEEMPQDHPSSVPLPEYQDVIPLQSLPGAPGVIYLDFDGSKGPHDVWSYRGDAAPSGLSNSTIRDIWIRVAEDFLPFNLNVTTDAKVYENATRGRRIRCIITPTNFHGAGGVAFVGSYNWGGDPVCWSLNYTGDGAVTVISHEVGHTLGLYHHGQNSREYYGGHGSGATSWAPIMGSGYGRTLKHWSDGSYYLATRPNQKDLTTITNQNGVDFRADDCGDTLATARYLLITTGNSVTNQQGLIETPGDADAYRFKTSGGSAQFTINTASIGINLDIKAEILNAATNAVISTSDAASSANATLSATLPAGEYLLRISGASFGTPTTASNGYSNYGSLGSYRIDGTVTGGETYQSFSIAEHSANGTSIGNIAPRAVSGSPLAFTIVGGNPGGVFAVNPTTGSLTVASSTGLDFEALSPRFDVPAAQELLVSVTNTATSASETLRVLVNVADVNEAPTLPSLQPVAVLERTTVGTRITKLTATDPDRFDAPSYEIVSGNADGYFAIDARSGWISVAKSPTLSAHTVVNLVVRARDQRTPVQTSAQQTLAVTLTHINDSFTGSPGSITRTFFNNLAGNAVTDLTTSAQFPNRPDSETFLTAFETPGNQADQYGSTVRGYLIPPVTGAYQFWIASDDASELILSADATPASAPVIASASGSTGAYVWTQQASQTSTAVTLTAGQPYYIEARQKDGSGNDYVMVAWSGPGISRQVIPGLYLAPFYQNYAPRISGAFSVMENAAAGTVVGTVTVTDVNQQDSHDSFAITAGNSGGWFAIHPSSGQITVAAAGLLNAATRSFHDLTIRVSDDGSPAQIGSATVRIQVQPSQLHFDPNGAVPGSVADGASYQWRTTSWATSSGGTAAVTNWIPNAQAIFSATTPPGRLEYDVDVTGYHSITHGGFSAIRALGGRVRFTGNVDQWLLTGNATIQSADNAAIEFNQTRTDNPALAFSLNGFAATFEGDVRFNQTGISNSGEVIVNRGQLTLNAANPYIGSTTVNAGGTLRLLGSGSIYSTLNWGNQTVTLNPGATLELDRWVGASRSLGQLAYGAQNLLINGATLRYSGVSNPLETNNGPGFTIGVDGATLESTQPGQTWRILADQRLASFGITSLGGPLVLTGAGNGSITKVIPGTTTSLVKTGSGTWFLGAANSYGGGTTVTSGTLQCNHVGSLPGEVTVESNTSDESQTGTLFMNVGNTTWSQSVSGAGRWRVATGSGSQTTVLSGNYTAFFGTLEVATGNGKIQLANAARYPAAGATILLGSGTSLYLSGGGTLAADLQLTGGVIGEPSYGQLRIGAANATIQGDITLLGNTTMAADSGRTATIHGTIRESGGRFGLTKNQPGTVVFTGENTYSGTTTVNVGGLQTGTSSGTFGFGNLVVANGASCQIRHPNRALGRQAFVFLTGTGRLDLASGVHEQVARLYVNGNLLPPGTYTSASLPGNLSGSGTLQVGETLPPMPSEFTASLASWNQVRLSWELIAVNSTAIVIERSFSATGGFSPIATLTPETQTYLDAPLPVLTTYHYRIRAENAAGSSQPSAVVSITTRVADPPVGLTAQVGNGQVTLRWSASAGAAGYAVKRASAHNASFSTIGTTTSTEFTDNNASNGIWFTYVVVATALGGESEASNEVTVRALPPSGDGIWAANSGGIWSDPDSWQDFVIADGPGASASFEQPAGGTITVDTVGRSLGTLRFARGNVAITGFPLVMSSPTQIPHIAVADGAVATLSSQLSGTQGLVKSGAGQAIVTTDSLVSGTVQVSAGTLTHRAAYAASAYQITAGAVLELDAVTTALSPIATTFSGSGTLRKSGSNRCFWGSAATTFALSSGALIDVRAGTLTGGSNANEVWTTNLADLQVASGAVFDGVEANVRVDAISGQGTVRTGFNGANYSQMAIGVDNGSSTFNGVITNSSSVGNLVKEGTGTITLAGNNSFTGNVTVLNGTLRITRSNGLGQGSKTVFLNAAGASPRLELDGSAQAINLANTIQFQTSNPAGSIVNLAGNNTVAGNLTLTSGNGNTRLTSESGALTVSGAISANASGLTLELAGNSTGANTISGVVGGSQPLAVSKIGTGSWILGGNPTYSGSTTVSQGTLTFAGNRTTALGGAISVGNTANQAATLVIQGDVSLGALEFGVGSGASGASGSVQQSAGVVSFTGGNALLIGRSTGGVTGSYTLSGGELRTFASSSRGVMVGVNAGSSGNPIVASFALSGTGFLNNATGCLQVVRGDSAASFQQASYLQSGGTSTNGSLIIGGNGLNGANSTATFAVTGGTFSASQFTNLARGNAVQASLLIANDADVTLPAFPSARGTGSTATLEFDGGTLRPSAASASYLSGLTQATLRQGGATLDVPSGRDITIAQAFRSAPDTSGGLRKTGPGTLTLTASHTYLGATNVQQGTLVASGSAVLGSGNLVVSGSAVCDLRNSAVGGALADAATVFLRDSARLALASGVSETVARLIVNQVILPAGTYTATSHPTLISGAGRLVVTSGLPTSPTALTASAVSAASISLSWIDQDTAESGYLIERAASANGPFTTLATLPANATSYSDAGLAAQSTWFYRVRAIGPNGNSGTSNVASATTLQLPPAPPSNLTATAGGFSVHLRWSAAATATHYRIQRSALPDANFADVATTVDTSYSDVGLPAGVLVYYRVAAVAQTSVGDDSAVVSATPTARLDWDGGDSTTPSAQGGSGAWSVTHRHWWNDATNAAWPSASTAAEAWFGGQAGTVTLAETPVAVNRLSFQTSGYLLQGGALTLSGSTPTIATAANTSTEVASVLTAAAGFTKTGPGTLVLSAKNQLGTATIHQGNVVLNPGATLHASPSPIVLGSGAAGTLGSVGNLSIQSDLTASSLSVVANTADVTSPGNLAQLLIASDANLSLSSFSAGLPSSSAGATRTALVTGPADSGGALSVSGNMVIGAAGAVNSTTTQVDLSGLRSLQHQAPSGVLRVGYGPLTRGSLTLATNNTINTASISVGETTNSGNSGLSSTLNLGSGINLIQTNELRIGFEKTAGVVQFGSPTGSVTITGTNGSGKTQITVGRATGGTYQGSGTNALLLAGRHATVHASTVIVGRKGTGTGSGNITAAVTFDTGSFDADQIQLAVAAFGNSGSSATGSFTVGSSPDSTGTLTVLGDVILASNTNTTNAQSAVGSLILRGGTTHVHGSIRDTSTTALGTSTTTLSLDGGVLDLHGNAIGGDGTAGNWPIDVIQFRTGTLRNVGEINHGAVGVTKSSTGTLCLEGTSTYSAPTRLQAGTLVLAGSIASNLTAEAGTLRLGESSTVRGALSLSPQVQIQMTPETSLNAESTVALAGTLVVSPSTNYAPGNQFTLVNKISTGAIVGTFANLPEAAVFATGDQSWQISYIGGDGNDVVITAVSPSSPADEWRTLHFGSPENAANAADNADPNADGEPNLLEYATGQNPLAASRMTPFLTRDAQGNQHVTYQRSTIAAAAGVEFLLEWSSSLTTPSWMPLGAGELIAIDGTLETRRAALPTPTAPQRFVRLKVTAP